MSILKWNIKRIGIILVKIVLINIIYFIKKKICFFVYDSKFNNKFYKILMFMINLIFDIKFEIFEKKVFIWIFNGFFLIYRK